MIHYCDASLLVATLVIEAHTEEARTWLGAHEAAPLAISGWVSAEVASALARKQRTGKLTSMERARAQHLWTSALAPRFDQVDMRPEDFVRVAGLVDVGSRGLRAGDALHLAVAERHGHALATLDRDLADAARAIGLVVPAIRHHP